MGRVGYEEAALHSYGVGGAEGFTLVEALVVVIVLGILAAIAAPVFQNVLSRAGRSACFGKIFKATFDGGMLRPDEPIELGPDTRVRLTVETTDDRERKSKSFLKTARSLDLEGPPDWSSRLDECLRPSRRSPA